MARSFSETMSELRKARGLSQRTAAADLHISQALLSHYENGAREPGLGFVCRACKYYGVSADYLLGMTENRSPGVDTSELSEILEELETLSRKVKEVMEATEK